MRDLSLHILDIVQNSIAAKATLVEIVICKNKEGWLMLTIKDNGKGIAPQTLESLKNPFFTTRTTRKVGLGIPLLYENAKRAMGDVTMESAQGKGTVIHASFNTAHIDCIPLGNLGQTLATLCLSYPEACEFVFSFINKEKTTKFDTREVKEILGEVPINTLDVLGWIEESINQEIEENESEE